MALRDWPVRWMQRLWVGAALIYGLFFLAGPVKNYWDRREGEQHQAALRVSEDSARAAMTPSQRAEADSLRDSLRSMLAPLARAFDSAASTPEFTQSVASVGAGLRRALILAFAIILTPAAILLILTTIWWLQRRRMAQAVGA